MDEVARFAAIMEDGAVLRRRLATEAVAAVIGVVDACEATIRGGGRLFFCGNGGSAADAQHLATELLVRLRSHVERPSWPAIALTLDPTALTAGGNDYGFEQVFARPLSGLGRAGDVLFGITTSGKSPNVVRALETARGMGIVTVGMLGGDGGPARALCDHALLVPGTETARIQEAHITLGHAVMELLEDRLVQA
ncbi:SIS domain-containing protein [Roseomonas eburnea]|uniref:Phosphoheptose isomerase n=1 Tax=Neoroseomonas eburnea TaxID=1346889 RepID=A0A9X9XGL6_9PROT|nr:SIS domain-containing protein [Neoroseomonas eburnea]MBR0682852.1 SIS domain-containing protein [Neoroseomonas eburnea]